MKSVSPFQKIRGAISSFFNNAGTLHCPTPKILHKLHEEKGYDFELQLPLALHHSIMFFYTIYGPDGAVISPYGNDRAARQYREDYRVATEQVRQNDRVRNEENKKGTRSILTQALYTLWDKIEESQYTRVTPAPETKRILEEEEGIRFEFNVLAIGDGMFPYVYNNIFTPEGTLIDKSGTPETYAWYCEKYEQAEARRIAAKPKP